MKNAEFTISDSLLHADWETIAHALTTLNNGVEGNSASARKLRAELGVVKVIMCESIRTWNGESSIDLSFFIGSYKTIQRLEKEFEFNGVKNRQFIVFLKLLLQKFGRQKLKVKKPLALIAEFGKMKGVIENGDNTL
ncbi:hypothetical protein KKB44_04640 [Candidatus Micrarchaeota archaeon]|nr:hypothetical protein [Candidatus Micrarchaeota archaeon]